MPEKVSVNLFESGHLGFGDSRKVRDFRYHRVHGSLDARWPGQFRMGLALESIANLDYDTVPVFAADWTPSDATPTTYFLVGRTIRRIRNGAVTQIGTNALGSANATTGMFDDDGSGIPYLYAGFGGAASSNQIARMDVNEVVTVATSGVRADILLTLNGMAYRTVTPTGGNANCQVSTCPPGSDRFTASLWSAGMTVGFAGNNINALASVRQAPVAVKPEGIFAYSEPLDRWVNHSPSWSAFPHPDNGKGTFSLGDRLVVPMGDGGAVIFDGRSVQPFDPVALNSTPNLHTTRGSLEKVGTLQNWLVGTTPSPSKLINAGSSLRVFTEISSVFTDGSANVRDANASTTLAIGSISAAPDALWIGWVHPFSAIGLELGTVNTASRTITLAVGQSDGTYVTVSHRDFTSLAGAPFGQDGAIVLTEDPVHVRTWDQTTVNSVTAYWLRVQISGGTLSAGTTVEQCRIQPWYPSVDLTNFPNDGLDKSGCFPHLLFALMAEEPIWHDLGSLPEPDSIGAILFTDLGGTSLNDPRNLYLIGRFRLWRLQVSRSDSPDTQSYPFLNNVGLIEGSAGVPTPEKLSKLVGIRINGQQFDPNVIGRFYWTWDFGKPWTRAGPTVRQVPAEHKVTEPNEGYLFRWAFGWQQASVAARETQSVVSSIDADFEILEKPLDAAQERGVQTLPRF